MRLVHGELNLDMSLEDNVVNILVVEKPEIMTQVLRELHNQVDGGQGGFVLSQADKLLSIGKNVILALEPLTISVNDKKIMNKIYQELYQEVEERHMEEKVRVNAILVEFMESILEHMQYPMIFEPDLDVLGLAKIFGIKVESSDDDLLRNIIEYIKLLSQLCGYSIFVFVNIKMYLTKEEVNYLYESAFYSKVKLILIENRDRGFGDNEMGYIFDEDGCLISCEK